ncbi:MAG: hypothetical protein LBJ46_01565 [Planctomycetota bacterium]|jgi:hypothetical protein|nr:hypothetical protein [Planctomycetota bacterium]
MAKKTTAKAAKPAIPVAKKASGKAAAPKLKPILGQESWTIANDDVEVSLTKKSGHMGPVTFFRKDRKFSPLSVAPWYKENAVKEHGSMLGVLRGDFFCMPFGGNEEPFGKEKFPGHGETACGDWKLTQMGATDPDCECGCGGECIFMTAEIKTRIRKARVEKLIALRRGDNAVYICHDIRGMSGPMDYGHHAMLKWDKQGAGLISTSKFKFGQVLPVMFEKAEEGGYQSLKPGAEFKSLDKVPLATGGYADLSVYPARLGFEDLVMVCSDGKGPFAWSAAVYPEQRLAWFALKDPAKLASTVLWHSNRGRHYAPWSGRHVGVLGIEEVTAYFHMGIAASVKPNPISRKGIPTSRVFKADEAFSIPYIMVATPVPAGFDHIKSIDPIDDNRVRLTSKSGKKADARVGWQFLNFDD